MKGKRLITFICVWLAAPCWLAAGEANRSWDELARIIVLGKKVAVTRMNAAVVEGKLTGITADSIMVQEKGAPPQTVERGDVFRVRYAGIQTKHTLWGVASGAVAGAAVLVIGNARDSHPQMDDAVVLGALLGLGAGAIVGGVLPVGPPLYEAERVVRKRP
jgi:hypothetical protein